MRRLAVTAAAMALAICSQANASVFTSRTAFTIAAGSLTTVDFNNSAGPSDTETYWAQSYSSSGVTFSLPLYNGQIYLEGLANPFPTRDYYGSDYFMWQNATPNTLTITLPHAVSAIGFDFAELRGGYDTFTIQVGANVYQADTVPESAAFFGVIEAAPFTQLTITDLPQYTYFVFPTIDNLSFGAGEPARVPEPASLLLLAGGAMGAFASRRRRRR